VALVNLIIQIVVGIVGFAAVVVARKRKVRRHCLLMRASVAVLIVTTVVSMTSPFVDFVRETPPLALFYPEMVVHHTLGLALIVLFIYINLSYTGVIKATRGFKAAMWSAASSWLATLVLGIHLYLRLHF